MCFVSPFFHQAPYCSSVNLHAVSLYLFTSTPLFICLSLLLAISVARLGLSLVEKTNSIVDWTCRKATAQPLVTRSNCPIKLTCLVLPPLSLSTPHQSILDHSSTRQQQVDIVAITIKEQLLSRPDFSFASCTQVPDWQNKPTRDTLNIIFNPPIHHRATPLQFRTALVVNGEPLR